MAEERRLDGVVIEVDGRALPVELYGRLTLVQVDESVRLPDSFALHFDDPYFELFDQDRFRLGARVQIAFRAEGEAVVVTSGEITAIAVQPGVSGRHELVLTGLDLTHRLARGPKTRTFLRMTEPDVASRIAREYGLDTDIDATSEVSEYIFQAAETDLAFLQRLAERVGFDMWVSERTFHYKRKPAGRTQPQVLRWGDNLQKFKVRFASAEQCDEVSVRGWNPVDKRAITGRSAQREARSDAPAVEEMAAASQRTFGRVTRSAGQYPVASQAEADALARSLLVRASSAEAVLRGEAAGNPWLGAGGEVRLERVGQRLAGTYRITSVSHIYGTNRPYTTVFECGGRDATDLADLVRPAGQGQSRPAPGNLVIGLVTNTDDPDKLGRVKVRYPTLSDQDESTWARLVVPGGGTGRGMQWIPEAGDEVLVGFEHGDKSRPVVLGGMWSRRDRPPEPTPAQGGKTKVRVLASRKNHRLTITDEPTGAIELTLGDAKSALHLKKAESTFNGEKKLVVSAEQVQITASGKLVIDAPEVEINGKQSVKITGRRIDLN